MTAEITGLQVNLFCRDVAVSLQFYVALGLREAFRTPFEGVPEHVEVDAGGTRIGLTSADAANRIAHLGVTAGAPPGGRSSEVVLWSDDVDALFAAAVAAGATELTRPMDSTDGRLRFSWVRDPDGHQVKFVRKL